MSEKSLKPLLLVHGGAGDISDDRITGKLEGMKSSIRKAKPLLLNKNSKTPALDAVEEAVRVMELDENFNAGYGSCLNLEGKVECEASIMDGKQLNAGCVTLIRDIMHPISVARRVMEATNYTFLGGKNAQQFALDQGFTQLQEGALETESARIALADFKARQAQGLSTKFARTELSSVEIEPKRPGEPGTVGAVAIDSEGNLAVATSTGGITGKIAGRIGDTPILGAGSYAENNVGCVSCTGHGETIMRFNLAQRILSLIRYKNFTAQEATETACKEMTKQLIGTGGAITIDENGKIGIYFTSQRMAWAYSQDENIVFGINHGQLLEEPLNDPKGKK